MTDTDTRAAAQAVADFIDDVEQLIEAHEWGELDELEPKREYYQEQYGIDIDDEPDTLDLLNEHALSIEHTWKGTNKSDAVFDSTTIVFGTGGPHVEAFSRGFFWTVIAYGWFGSDRVEIPVEADWLDAVLDLAWDT